MATAEIPHDHTRHPGNRRLDCSPDLGYLPGRPCPGARLTCVRRGRSLAFPGRLAELAGSPPLYDYSPAHGQPGYLLAEVVARTLKARLELAHARTSAPAGSGLLTFWRVAGGGWRVGEGEEGGGWRVAGGGRRGWRVAGGGWRWRERGGVNPLFSRHPPPTTRHPPEVEGEERQSPLSLHPPPAHPPPATRHPPPSTRHPRQVFCPK